MTVENLVKLLSGKYRFYKIKITHLEGHQTVFNSQAIIKYVVHSMFNTYEWTLNEHNKKKEIEITLIHHETKELKWQDVPNKTIKPINENEQKK